MNARRSLVALALFLALADAGAAQFHVRTRRVEDLPPCDGSIGMTGRGFQVYDGQDPVDCSAGGATGDDRFAVVCLCSWDGWVALLQDGSVSGSSPGGADTQVQYNAAGLFAGDAGLTYNAATDAITAGSFLVSGVARGNASGPASSVDNEPARFDSTTGKLVQGGTLIRFLDPVNSPTGAIDLLNLNASGTPTLVVRGDGGSSTRLEGSNFFVASNFAQTEFFMSDSVIGGFRMASDWVMGWTSSATNVVDNGNDTTLSRSSVAVVKIDDALRLDPIAVPPVTCGDANTSGVIYNDSSQTPDVLCYCDGADWQPIPAAGTCP